jgi:hypothetical protein
MPYDPNEPSINQDEYTQQSFDCLIKNVPGWFPELSAPYDRMVLVIFTKPGTLEHIITFGVKRPAGLYGDVYKDAFWMSYHTMPGIDSPTVWMPAHLPEKNLFDN